MKKVILSIILAFVTIVCVAKPYDYSALDSKLVTFMMTPNSVIDTTFLVNKKKVVVKGMYVLEPLTIKIDIATNNSRILNHCVEVFEKNMGFVYGVSYYYDLLSYPLFIQVYTKTPQDLKGYIKDKYESEILAYNTERLERERIAEEQRLERERIAEEQRQATILYLDSLKIDFKNRYEENVAKSLASSLVKVEKFNKINEDAVNARFKELDKLEQAHIGRLDQEVFLTKKNVLDGKYQIIFDKCREGISNVWREHRDLKTYYNNLFISVLNKNGVKLINRQAYIQEYCRTHPLERIPSDLTDTYGNKRLLKYEKSDIVVNYDVRVFY